MRSFHNSLIYFLPCILILLLEDEEDYIRNVFGLILCVFNKNECLRMHALAQIGKNNNNDNKD